MDISNGKGVGISLFVQGCHFHCKNCFNSSIWDFDGGKEWTEDKKNEFLKSARNPFIKRISILGGEPLADENLKGVLDLVNEIRLSMPEKTIWLYSGYTWEETNLMMKGIDHESLEFNRLNNLRREIIKQCNVMVDGRYVDELKDLSLSWRGSSNQRIINVQGSIRQQKLILYSD